MVVFLKEGTVITFKELFFMFIQLSYCAVAFESFCHSDSVPKGNTSESFCPHLSQSHFFDYAFYSGPFPGFCFVYFC